MSLAKTFIERRAKASLVLSAKATTNMTGLSLVHAVKVGSKLQAMMVPDRRQSQDRDLALRIDGAFDERSNAENKMLSSAEIGVHDVMRVAVTNGLVGQHSTKKLFSCIAPV